MAAATGTMLPALQSRIKPERHLQFQWIAFARLSTDRQSVFAVGGIPWTAMDRYAERYEIDDPDERERYFDLLRAMDLAFIDWHRKD